MNFILVFFSFFFFQAEDGIRDLTVTGVQTCALPISNGRRRPSSRSRRGISPRGCAGPPTRRSRSSRRAPRLFSPAREISPRRTGSRGKEVFVARRLPGRQRGRRQP